MPRPVASINRWAIVIAVVFFALMALRFSAGKVRDATRKALESSSAYQAACEGSPLRTLEARNQAMEDGYEINRRFDCVDKASFSAVANNKARWQAANTPEAKAKVAAERAQGKLEQEQQALAAAVASFTRKSEPPAPPAALRPVEINTASEAELAEVIGIGADTAADIMRQRNQRRFQNWPDLVHRVVRMSAARSVFYASVGGLTVDGAHLTGAPADPVFAARVKAGETKRDARITLPIQVHSP
ncbi:MAG: helix-hairpin-helix domain-containing protein [Burkholderiales bacterium]